MFEFWIIGRARGGSGVVYDKGFVQEAENARDQCRDFVLHCFAYKRLCSYYNSYAIFFVIYLLAFFLNYVQYEQKIKLNKNKFI